MWCGRSLQTSLTRNPPPYTVASSARCFRLVCAARINRTPPWSRIDGRVREWPRGGRETVLIVEDEAEVRHLVERVLSGAGYEVLVAGAGAEAIDLARRTPNLQLLITDVVMPGMSGVQLAAHLTATRPGLPVIYASGYSDEGVPRGTDDGYVASYLPKPFTAEKLLRQVRETLDRRAAVVAPASSEDQPVA